MTRVVGSASPMLRSAAPAVAFAILYFLVAKLTNWLVGDPGIVVLWPASGVYLGAMLLAPREQWPALSCAAGVGSLAAYLHGGTSLELSIAFAVPSSAGGLLGALLVERLTGKRFRLLGLRDVVTIVAGGAVLANALVALSAAAVAAQSFNVSFAESWLRWWTADALGVIAVAPILTAPLRRDPRRPLARELRVAASMVAGLGFAIYVALSSESAGTGPLVGAAIAFPVLLWAGWRWGPRASALGGLGVALAATHVAVETYPVQGFLAILLLGSLVFAAAIADRERDLGRLKEELESRRDAADRTTDELKGTADELDAARQRIAQLTADLAARSVQLHDATRGRDAVARDLRVEQGSKQRTERDLEDATRDLSAARRDLSAARQELGAARQEIGAARRDVEKLERDLGLAADDRDRARRDRDDGARALRDLRARLEGLEGELETARSEQARAGKELADATSGRRRAEHELELVSRRLDGLDAELGRARIQKAQSEQALSAALARAEADAEAERQRLREAEAEMTSRYDERGICLSASPQFARLLGYEPGELAGCRGADLLHPEDRPRLTRARATGSQTTFEGRLRRKSGEFVWVEVTLDPVLAWGDARVVELRTTIRDISASRKAAEPIAAWQRLARRAG